MHDHEDHHHPADPTAGDARPPRVIVRPQGELDVSTVGALSADVIVAEANGADVVVDLRDVTFIDSTCITTLIHLASRARKRDASVTVLATQPMMRRIFGIMELDAHVTVDPPLTVTDLLSQQPLKTGP